jgi:ribose/xylose/arabinose/galactoside ABC-type transport system permease subunit
MTQALATLRNSGALIVLVVTYVVFSVAAPSFFGVQNLLDIVHVISPMMIVATGMALVVMSGKLDISVGSIAYVASALFALIMRNGGLSFPAAVAISIMGGLALGCVNAAIVVGLRVNSLIATLGTMIAFRGLGLCMTDGGLVVLPEPIKALGNVAIGPLYVDTIIALIILLAVQLLHRRTTFGRQLTAIGNNEDVARRIGIPVDRRTVATLLISGGFAAIAGVIYTLQVGVNTAKIGDGMEFTAVAAVVVGGISLFGGRGNILTSVILGSLIFQIIRSGLQQVGANPYSYRLVEGVVIFIAMYADALKTGHIGSGGGRLFRKG